MGILCRNLSKGPAFCFRSVSGYWAEKRQWGKGGSGLETGRHVHRHLRESRAVNDSTTATAAEAITFWIYFAGRVNGICWWPGYGLWEKEQLTITPRCFRSLSKCKIDFSLENIYSCKENYIRNVHNPRMMAKSMEPGGKQRKEINSGTTCWCASHVTRRSSLTPHGLNVMSRWDVLLLVWIWKIQGRAL